MGLCKKRHKREKKNFTVHRKGKTLKASSNKKRQASGRPSSNQHHCCDRKDKTTNVLE